MANHTSPCRESVDFSWDWLVALSPLLLIMVVNYRWAAVWAVLCAAIGHFAATVLWRVAKITFCHPAPSLLCGALVACCLPSTVPVWVSVVGGFIGGVVTGIPALLNRYWKKDVACPIYLPAFVGFLSVRWLFAAQWKSFAVPALWLPADTVSGATPLAAVGDGPATAERAQRLFWGLEPGSMGHGPVLALLLGCAYLMLRRRLRSFAPLAMLAVIGAVFGLLWGQVTYGWMLGGTLLAALLLADGDCIRVKWKGQLVIGWVAGVVTLCGRFLWGVDGSAVGVLVACGLIPFLRLGYRELRRTIPILMQKFAKSAK